MESLVKELFMYLDSRDSRRRKLGVRLLKKYFREDFGYQATGDQLGREDAISNVKAWWQENKAELVFDGTDKKFIRQNKDK